MDVRPSVHVHVRPCPSMDWPVHAHLWTFILKSPSIPIISKKISLGLQVPAIKRTTKLSNKPLRTYHQDFRAVGAVVNLSLRFDEELFFFFWPWILLPAKFQTLLNPLALRSTLALVKQCRVCSSMSPFWLQASHSRRQNQSIFGQPYSSCRLSTCQ